MDKQILQILTIEVVKVHASRRRVTYRTLFSPWPFDDTLTFSYIVRMSYFSHVAAQLSNVAASSVFPYSP